MKIIGILFLLLCSCSLSQAQTYLEIIRKNVDQPFHEIVQQVENYYQNKDKGRGSYYKQFKRWEYFNARRLNEDGKLQNVSRRLLDEFTYYKKNFQQPEELNFDCDWECLGGTAYELIQSGHNGGLGRVNCITFDPSDNDIIYVGTPAGGLWRTDSGGGSWDPGSSITHWTPLTDGLPNIGVSGIAIDPNSPANSRTIYLLTGDGDGRHNPSIGVLKSFDGGSTWTQTGLSWGITDFNYGFKLIMHPTDANILLAATSRGIFRTTDGGITWTNEQTGFFFDIEFRPGTPNIVYATTNSDFLRSVDGGDTWTEVSCGFVQTGVRMAIGVTPADPDYVYVISGGNLLDNMGISMPGTFRGLYRSTNSGVCFTLRASTPNILASDSGGDSLRQQAAYDLAIAVSPTDENEVHVGGVNSWRYDDVSQNFTLTAFWDETQAGTGNYNHADVHALEFSGNTLYAGTDGGFYLSTNNADDWINVSQGLKITQLYRIGAFSDDGSDYVMGGAQDNGLNQLMDSGSGFGNLEHWEGGDGFECSADVANDFVYGATQLGRIFRYNYPDAGFTEVTDPNLSRTGAWLTPHYFDATRSAIVAGYTDVWRSTDNGGNWNNISNGNIGAGLCSHMVQAPSDSNRIYLTKDLNPGSAIFTTSNDGVTWTNITGTLPVANDLITYIAVHPTDPQQVWVTLGGFVEQTDPNEGYIVGNKVFYSPDTGATWQNISGSLPNIPANTIVYEIGSDDGLYVGMDVGVYYRDNNLADWVLFSNLLPNVIISELEINYNTGKLYAGTFGRGVWCTDLFSSCNETCLDCPIYAGLHSPSNVFKSRDCIYSTATVFDNTDIVYEAEEFILLQEGFYSGAINQEATFHGLIEECVPGSGGGGSLMQYVNHRKLPGYYLGKIPEYADQGYRPASNLKAFPNPTSDVLHLEIELQKEGRATVILYDILGKKVRVLEQNSWFDQGKVKRQYSINDLEGGSYVVEFDQMGLKFYQTIIKLEQ